MDPEAPYSKRELDKAFDGIHESIHNFRDGISPVLLRLEDQVMKTNGRVGALEKWQSYVIGFCACVSLFLIPVLVAMATKFFT